MTWLYTAATERATAAVAEWLEDEHPGGASMPHRGANAATASSVTDAASSRIVALVGTGTATFSRHTSVGESLLQAARRR